MLDASAVAHCDGLPVAGSQPKALQALFVANALKHGISAGDVRCQSLWSQNITCCLPSLSVRVSVARRLPWSGSILTSIAWPTTALLNWGLSSEQTISERLRNLRGDGMVVGWVAVCVDGRGDDFRADTGISAHQPHHVERRHVDISLRNYSGFIIRFLYRNPWLTFLCLAAASAAASDAPMLPGSDEIILTDTAVIDVAAVKNIKTLLERLADKRVVFVGESHDRYEDHLQLDQPSLRVCRRRATPSPSAWSFFSSRSNHTWMPSLPAR